MSAFHIEFKYLKNRQIDVGNGFQYVIPMKQKKLHILGHETTTPVFNLEAVHKVELLDETPQIPVRDHRMSERLFTELCDEAYKDAMGNRRKNDAIRARLQAFVKSGTLEILHDPFARETKADEMTTSEPQSVVPDQSNNPDFDAIDETAEAQVFVPGESSVVEANTENFDDIKDEPLKDDGAPKIRVNGQTASKRNK